MIICICTIIPSRGTELTLFNMRLHVQAAFTLERKAVSAASIFQKRAERTEV